jgi:16S rRNA (cytidine1402-2'-O)-methyltransferase
MPSNSPINETDKDSSSGTLFVVATPIGNRDDITLRALVTLKSVHLIAAEDTRLTGRLLHHFDIKTALTAYHEHNEAARTPQLVSKLRQGVSIALVSSAGTPTVSDPGYRLITEAIKSRIQVVPIPGACAAITALCAAGLPTDSFTFVGFPPKKEGPRRRRMEALAGLGTTLIFYESPRRIKTFIQELMTVMGDRQAVLTRELTKIHEEFLRGSLANILRQLERRPQIRGEFTLLIEGAPPPKGLSGQDLDREIRRRLAQGQKVSQISRTISDAYGLKKKDVYDRALEINQNHERKVDQ